MTVPDRIAWALDLLAPRPGEDVLELGCGPGVAAGLLADRVGRGDPVAALLTDRAGTGDPAPGEGFGHVIAVDRSETAVRRTAEWNAAHVAAGRLVVVRADVADLQLPAGSVDAVLAVDVNLFWTRSPAPELAVLREMLRPGGRMCLVFSAPARTPDEARDVRIVRPVVAALGAAGWTADVRTDPDGTLVGVLATP